MLNLTRIATAIAIATLAGSALAGNSWPQSPSGKSKAVVSGATATTRDAAASPKDFTYRGDGIGWEVTQHKYVLANGRLVHSNECDHMIRTARAPTPAEVESGKLQSPGA